MSLEMQALCLLQSETLRAAIAAIDRNQRGIALIVDDDRKLIGTITDGDARRAMLSGKSLETPIAEILAQKAASPYRQPVTAPIGTDRAILLKTMHDLVIRQIPLLDENGRVAGLVTMDELLPDEPVALQAVIMAGGFGKRMMPLTEHTPKPMLPIGDKPLMELIIDQLRDAGIHQVNVTTHYQREKIKEHFGDGQKYGVSLNYLDEEQPLGTAGALSMMHNRNEPFLVINGDILTNVDFRAMLQFHKEHHADMTLGVRRYDFEVPYGVVECEVVNVQKLTEKPQYSFFVNAGIYLLEPSVHELIPKGESFNMTDVIQLLLDAGRPVVSFPIREYWLDIGRQSDYELAQEFAKGNRTA